MLLEVVEVLVQLGHSRRVLDTLIKPIHCDITYLIRKFNALKCREVFIVYVNVLSNP